MKLYTEHIRKTYKGRPVVNGVSVEVNQGEILIFSFLAKIDKEVLVRNSKIINVVLHSGELLIGQVILK